MASFFRQDEAHYDKGFEDRSSVVRMLPHPKEGITGVLEEALCASVWGYNSTPSGTVQPNTP